MAPLRIRESSRAPVLAMLAALSCPPAPARTLALIEDAYEARIDGLALISETLLVAPCNGCPPRRLLLGPETVYIGTEGPTSYDAFAATVADFRLAPASNRLVAVFVFCRAGTDRVTRVRISVG